MAPRMLFVNLAVQDLPRAKAFFTALGFSFNTQFTNDAAACMVISDRAFVMLVTREMFGQFTTRPLADALQVTEGLYALSCDDRDEVDRLAQVALDHGGAAAMPPQDHGFMYSRSFYDLDGHHWEVFWMDPAHVQSA